MVTPQATPSDSSESGIRPGCAHPRDQPSDPMDESEDDDSFKTFDFKKWKDSLTPLPVEHVGARVGEVTNVSRHLKCPVLHETHDVYKWINAIENFTRLCMKVDLQSSHDIWCTLAQFSVDSASTDPMMPDFMDRLREFPLPGDRQTSVGIPYHFYKKGTRRFIDRSRLVRDCWKRNTSATTEDIESDDDLGPSYTATRPMAVWEWLREFVTKVWVTPQRKESFKRHLVELRFVEGPACQDPMIASSRLDTHVAKVKNLLELAQVSHLDDRATYLKNTFLNDIEVYEKVINCRWWDNITEEVKAKIQARHLAQARVPGGTRVNAIVVPDRQPRPHPGRQWIPRPRPAAMPRPRFQPRAQPYGRPNRGPVGQLGGQNRGPVDVKPRIVNNRPICWWCGMEGHRQRTCQAKEAKMPSRVPPCPPGVTFADHVRQVIKDGKLL